MQLVLTPELIIEAYKQGVFPMAYHAGSPYVQWICPQQRGQLDIENLYISKSLKKSVNKAVRSENIDITINQAFGQVIAACGERSETRPETWINDQIRRVFTELHHDGHAHSVEFWEDGELRGGLYGLATGAAFFGESMFSRRTEASKICLVHLAARLWRGGFKLLDTQFINEHLKQFGVYEIAHKDYMQRLTPLLGQKADFIQSGVAGLDILNQYWEMRAAQDVRSIKSEPAHTEQPLIPPRE
jgi:leucyl/phenylalanyl-tRNA--protein transferase